MVSEVPLQIDWSTVLRSVSVMVAAYLLARGLSYGMTALSNRTVERRITVKMLIPLIKLGIYGFALYYILVPVFELSSSQVLAVSGLIGAGIGFGLKDLFANVIGGLVLIAERPYKVGDKITIGDHYGEVMDIGLRSTKLQTPDDTLVSVPNYKSFTEAVANANAGNPEMLVTVGFTVDKEANLDEATRVVEEALVTSDYVYLSEKRPYDVQVRDEGQAIAIEGRAYVNDHRNELAFVTDIAHRVTTVFQERDLPRPQYRRLTRDGQ
jgi:small-conductance mechanosensitive channel